MEFETLWRELAISTEIIKALVSGIIQEEAQIRPTPDAWSTLEVICHLYDEEREDFRQRLDIILHHPNTEAPPIDPGGWVIARKYNERNFAEMLDSWLAERQKSLAWLKSLTVPDWDREYKAPFGRIKAGDMFAAWVAHDNLHIRQLVELRRARVERITQPYDIQYAGEW